MKGLSYVASSIQSSSPSTSLPIVPYKFCDIGLNLMDDMYRGVYRGKAKHENDILQVLKRGKAYGVVQAIVTGCTLDESKDSLQFCREYVNTLDPSERGSCIELYTTIGIHPTHSSVFQQLSGTSDNADSIIDSLEQLIIDGLGDNKVVALGECGLDYDRLHFCSKDDQIRGFCLQLELSSRLIQPLPLFLHNRNTQGDFYQLLRTHCFPNNLRKSGVVHSFDGCMDELNQALELGLYIGINGCSLKTQDNLNILKHIPNDRLLLETDAPWCGMKPTHASYSFIQTTIPLKKVEKYDSNCMVKDRNEPCTMIQLLEVVAAVRQQNPNELADIVYNNSQKLFFS